MITPFDIENKEFSKSMRGYNAVEVDEFLDLIILDLEKIMAENEKLKKENEQLAADLRQYKKSESSVLNTLESAKKLMNDISESAEKRAEIIIRNAKLDASMITAEAKESVSKLTEESEKLKSKITRFKEKYRQMLEDELSQLDGSSEDLFADLEEEFLPASIDDYAAAAADSTAPKSVTAPPKMSDTAVNLRTPKKEENGQLSRDTIVATGKTLEEILMEDFGASHDMDKDKTLVKKDLTKTRIL